MRVFAPLAMCAALAAGFVGNAAPPFPATSRADPTLYAQRDGFARERDFGEPGSGPPRHGGPASIPTPTGLYVLTDYSNNPSTLESTLLPVDLESDPTFQSDAIAGVAIYLTLSEILPDPLPAEDSGRAWRQLFGGENPAFDGWDWTYLDRTIATALRHKKRYSLAVVVGYQSTGSTLLGPEPADSYLQVAFPNAAKPFKVPGFEQSLPSWFERLCNPQNAASYHPLPLAPGGSPKPGASESPWTPDSCAPTFDVGHAPRACLSFKIPLPWNRNVEMFWAALARALSDHLRRTCYSGGALVPCSGGKPPVYAQLTLVHLPGLSQYDEELFFPNPVRPLPDSTERCPDGRVATARPSNGHDWATNSIAYDQSAYALTHDFGYREFRAGNGRMTTNLIEGFETIARSFTRAFPDRVMALSPLNDVNDVDLPDLAKSFGPGGESRKIAVDLAAFLRSIGSAVPLEIQSDDLAALFWNPNGPWARSRECSTPYCVDPAIPWVNPQHFFSGVRAVYGWQTGVGGVVRLRRGVWTLVAQCVRDLRFPSACTDTTAAPDLASFYGLLKYAWQPVVVKGLPVQYLEVMPGDIILRPKSIQKAVLQNGWFAPRSAGPD